MYPSKDLCTLKIVLNRENLTHDGHILIEDNAKYLGVVINKTLSCNDHINGVTKKANANPMKKSKNWRGKIKNQCLFQF